MASAVNLTSDDLMAEIGRLTMEVKARAAREDQLVRQNEAQQAQIAEMQRQLMDRPEEQAVG
jgi:hypothetical protein